MSNTNPSTNMSLPVPAVSVDPGPDWATNLNNCLTILDMHNHAAGSGVQISPSGLNINSDLPIGGNNLTVIRSVRLQAQSAPLALAADLGCLYESGVDLYFNDGAGNQVRITQSGGVAGTPGSIANLVPPASASYVSGNETFVFQSDVNKPGNLDGGYLNLRNNSVSSFALTLSPPAAMGANYTLTLPSVPLVQNIMMLDSSGAMSAALNVDNSTIQISTNNIQIKDRGVTQIKRALMATGTTVAAGGIAVSTSSGGFSTSSQTFVDVTNLSVTITTTGRPVAIALIPDPASNTTNSAKWEIVISNDSTQSAWLKLVRDSTDLGVTEITSALAVQDYPIIGQYCIDVVAAGTYTYKLQAAVSVTALTTTVVQYLQLVAYEI